MNTTHVEHRINQLKSRWSADWDPSKSYAFVHAARGFYRSFDLAMDVAKKVATVEGDKDYSAEGRKSILRKWLSENARMPLREVRGHVDAARSEAAQKVAGLTLFKRDPNDIAGAIRRSEVRNWLRTLDSAAVTGIVLSKDTSGEVIDALLDSPVPITSFGLPHWDELKPRLLQIRFPEAMAEIEALGEAATLADVAAGIAANVIKSSGAFEHDRAFGEWAEAA